MRTKLLSCVLCLALFAPTPGCGTLLFGERHGKESGRIDPNVVLMDGLLLLVFILPGVVAFVVDFATGAIYLPEGSDGEGPFFD